MERTMKILVTGSNGFLGSIFCLQAMEGGHQVLGTVLQPRFVLPGCETKPLDIRDQGACLDIGKDFQPDLILHCARYTVGLGQCERERELTFQINTLGTRNMVRSAEMCAAFFVYFSTDWIFSGKKPIGEKYQEDDDPSPLSYYGFTKLASEQVVERSKTKWLIIRPANIYGVHGLFQRLPRQKAEEAMGRSSWTHKMIVKLEQGERIWLPEALYQCPVLADHLASVTLRLVKEGRTGVYHVAGREGVSRRQFLRTVAEVFRFDPDLVQEGSLNGLEEGWEIPSGLSGTLPMNACLDVGKVETTLGMRMLTLREGLSEMKRHLNRS